MGKYNRDDYPSGKFIDHPIPEGIEAQITEVKEEYSTNTACDVVTVKFDTAEGSINNRYTMNEKFGFLLFKLATACGLGDTFDSQDLIGKHCRIIVIQKPDSQYCNVSKVEPSVKPYTADTPF